MAPLVNDDDQEEFGAEHFHRDMERMDVEMREEEVVMEDGLLEESVMGMRVDDFEMDAGEQMQVEDNGHGSGNYEGGAEAMYEKLLALRNTTRALVEAKFELPGYALNPAEPTQAMEIHITSSTSKSFGPTNEERIAIEKSTGKTDKAYRMERMLAKMSTFGGQDYNSHFVL